MTTPPALRAPAPTRAATAAPGVPRYAVVRPANDRGPGSTRTAPAVVHEVLRSAGQPLPAATRSEMEKRFGHDLGAVRVHTDARAADSARAVDARAYTVGRNVVFGAGEFAPGTTQGAQLLAHELVHTLQQGHAPAVTAGTLRTSPARAAAEAEADRLSRGPRHAGKGPVPVTRTGAQLARQPAPGVSPVRQRLELAKDLLSRASGGPGMLNGLVASGTVIELRHAQGSSTTFRIGNPLKQVDRNTLVRDGNAWEVHEAKLAPGDTTTPRIVLDEAQTAGDLALNLFRGQRQLTWAAHDPQRLERSVPLDDQAKAKAEYVKEMVEAVAYRNFEQLELKRALQSQGGSVSTSLPFEKEYNAAYQSAFIATMSRKGSVRAAAGDATSAAYRVIEDALKTGRVVTHTREAYANHFAHAWEKARADWARRNPQRAAEGEHRHRLEAGMNALAELAGRVDPKSQAADDVIGLIDSFAMLYGGTAQILFVGRAHAALERLLGPFGYRTVEGVDVGALQRERLEYALLNFRALKPAQRSALRQNPLLATRFGINIYPTAAELQAKDRLVAARTLPDGTLHTGTLAEFRWASENNRINHILAQLQMIRSSGPASLIGRIAYGEEGAAIGAMIDAGLTLRAPLAARRNQQRQMQNLDAGNPPRPSARLEPIGHRAPAPVRTPMPAPQPIRVTDAEVVATNARQPAAIVRQDPATHQANWQKLGGVGSAPLAYRHAGHAVYVSTSNWLLKPPQRVGIPPVSVRTQPAPAPANRDVGTADTLPPPPTPAPVANKLADPPVPVAERPAKAPVVVRVPPRPSQIVRPDAPTGAAQTGDQPAPGVLAGGNQKRHIDPPQGISAEGVRRIQQMPAQSARKGRGNSVNYSIDANAHRLAWQRLGGHGDPPPPAFIYDGQVYLDPSRWPRSGGG